MRKQSEEIYCETCGNFISKMGYNKSVNPIPITYNNKHINIGDIQISYGYGDRKIAKDICLDCKLEILEIAKKEFQVRNNLISEINRIELKGNN